MIKQEQIYDPQFRLNWIRLTRSSNVGPRTFWDLIRIYVTPTTALEQIPNLAKNGGSKKEILIPSINSIKEEIAAAEKFGAKLITAYDEIYPYLLKEIPDAPPVITVKGDINLLKKEKQVAIVGFRNASSNGCSFAKNIARDLGEVGYVIVSGLAKGIDYFAHQGSLDSGTIGVIAGGIDNIYPQENSKLYNLLYERGLVISEFPFGTSPIAKHFPQRNRIISGLSLAVVVVEAALKSGTLITSRFAIEQGREVFAVPGSPLDMRCQGTNTLIKQGAHLLETYQDLIDVIGLRKPYHQSSLFDSSSDFISPYNTYKEVSDKELENWRKIISEKLSYTPCSIDELIKQTKIPVPLLSRIIVEMELAGKVERLYGNKVVLLYL